MPFDNHATFTARRTFRFPGGDARTIVIGATGTGKTTMGAWLLSHMRFDKRPWIIFDYKGEELFEQIGEPPLIPLKVGQRPYDRGLHIASILPNQDDAVEAWLWKLWQRGNCGLFVDEAALIPPGTAIKAVLRQGRSKRLPVIACTQRPIGIDREFFSEANFMSIYRVQDERDYKVIAGFTRNAGFDLTDLPPHWSYWYDVGRNVGFRMRPVPPPPEVADRLRAVAPKRWRLFA